MMMAPKTPGVGILVLDPGYDAGTQMMNWIGGGCINWVESWAINWPSMNISGIFLLCFFSSQDESPGNLPSSSTVFPKDGILLLDRRYGTSEYPGADVALEGR